MNSSPTVLPTTIDEVITQLDDIVRASEASGSRIGYFPAMYNRVTRRTKERIANNAFEDNERMERFDVIFANRYLAAYYDYMQGKPCSESWKITFQACDTWTPLVIQHLIASMNAHINLDLGIAAAETQKENLPSLKNDFNQINDILDSLIDEVESELREIFHPLTTFDKLTGNVYWRVAHVGIVKARADAWQVAEAYSQLQSEEERQIFIKERDRHVATIGNKVLKPPVLVKMAARKLRFFERGDIASKVRVLDRRGV